MEPGARAMRKSTRPASRNSKPGSCTLMTRCLGGGVGGRGCNNSTGSTLFGTMLQGHYGPTDDDPKWIPIGGTRSPYGFL